MALFIAAAMLIFSGVVEGPASAVATAPAAAQCNPPDIPTGAGYQVTCNITIENTVTSQGATSSTVTATECLAAAGVLPPFGCNTTITTSTQLVTSVDQCNGIVTGGGSNVTCNVTVIDNVPTGTGTSGVSVYQCVGSGTGGGANPLNCGPSGSTFSSTVNQCNGSGNGGGAPGRVTCSVTGAATALPVTITQCNGSSNGGGSTVTCMSTFTNNFATPTPPVTTTTTPPVTSTTTPPVTTTTTPPTTTGGGSGVTGGGGSTGSSGGASPGGGSAGGAAATSGSSASPSGSSVGSSGAAGTASPSVALPNGSPQTGAGGASRSGDNPLMVGLGAAALIGAMAAAGLGLRRRRVLSALGETNFDGE